MSADRIYPLARPKGHKPPMERWKLEFDDDQARIHTAYIGVQRHESTVSTIASFEESVKAIQTLLDMIDPDERPAYERFEFVEGDDQPETTLWVCYWCSSTAYENCIQQLNLTDIYNRVGRPTTVGLWLERFTTPVSRLETNYSGLEYLPGLAKLPGSQPKGHTLTAYWGAARDRIPDSGHDLFSRESEETIQSPADIPTGIGEHLLGGNEYDNLVHIRSGQFWQNCSETETAAYEGTLEPTLRAGLRYLWENRTDSGAMGLRFLRNLDLARPTSPNISGNGASAPAPAPAKAKETSAAGFFRNLADLEKWAKRHPSHLAIFNGAIAHARAFGENRRFRTWHEVSVLKRGEASFEYVNCLPKTGVISFLRLDRRGL
ncbi:heme-containing dehydratase protein [Aspergillus pseudoustus]|uniref:Heme-containing dehydratase protein n=1 Tax=Aspergillus pseudoustus TaxID=1810923 RepID=A0ABR4IIU2_9EURO